jgi:hypothetical protein
MAAKQMPCLRLFGNSRARDKPQEHTASLTIETYKNFNFYDSNAGQKAVNYYISQLI